MAIIRYKEIGNLSEKDLESKFNELKNELIKAKAQVATGSAIENPGKVKEIKRTVARILTFKNQGGKLKSK